MAGYLFTLDSYESLEKIVEQGVYSTVLSNPSRNAWGIAHEGTFADYLSMKEGDLIFFFINRKIYGCGQLVKIGNDCKYFNYTGAKNPHYDENNYESTHILNQGDERNRCFCIFEPHPYFFKKGVDMDEVLQNKSNPFRSVRTLWKLSFIKMDDDESDALFGVILKSNESFMADEERWFKYDETTRNQIARLSLYDYKISRSFLINNCTDFETKTLKHEMALEAALCEILTNESVEPFGKWDYVTHQVPASPFKPIDYMDKMDIFGYRYIQGYKVKSRYLVAELKKGWADRSIVEQIMKYVDWVANEYANSDYSMIEAYVIAAEFSDEIVQMVKNHCIRNYNKGFRPTEFCVWKNIKMVKYSVREDEVFFETVSLSE